MNIGNRVIFDQDGEIILQMGEMTGDVLPRKEITNLYSLDFEYGQFKDKKIVGIDISTMQPILEDIIPSDEQKRIKELEDALLLQVESEIGGIL